MRQCYQQMSCGMRSTEACSWLHTSTYVREYHVVFTSLHEIADNRPAIYVSHYHNVFETTLFHHKAIIPIWFMDRCMSPISMWSSLNSPTLLQLIRGVETWTGNTSSLSRWCCNQWAMQGSFDNIQLLLCQP